MAFTKEQKQKFLNTFIQRVNGKGACRQGSLCEYVRKGHPGCAIGCQDEFQPFKAEALKHKVEGDISEILELDPNSTKFGERLAKAFGIANCYTSDGSLSGEVSYLCDLQMLHDRESSWEGNLMRKAAVQQFCDKHNLELPEMGKESE